jgi:hypothetical protein
MRRFIFVTLALAVACSRETPAPPPAPTTTTTAPEVTTTTSVPELQKGSYDEALLWFRSNTGFHFVLDDHGVHAEGEVTRETPGAEKVQLTADGTAWLAETSVQGVTWKRRDGNAWRNADAPEFGARIFQRVTLPFDPQKKEGVPILASHEGETNVYRFTDANTGDVHEWFVRKRDAAVERIKIGGDKVDLKITSEAPSAVEGPR